MIINNLLPQLIKVLICLVFLTPLIVSSNTIYASVVGKAIYSNILIEIIFGLWLILIFYNKAYRPKLSLVYLSLVVYLIVITITSLFGVDFARSFWSDYERMQGIFTFIHWVGLILVIVSVCKIWQDYRNIIIVNACVSIIVCLGMILGYDGLLFFSDHGENNKTRFIYSTVMGNTSFLAQYCVTTILLTLYVAVKHYSIFTKILSWINVLSIVVIVLNIITIWYASSRAAYLSIFVFMLLFGAIYLFTNNTKVIKYISYISISLVLFFILFIVLALNSDLKYNALYEQSHDRIAKPLEKVITTFDEQNIFTRIVALKIGMQAFYDNPLRGIGNENYIVAWGRYIEDEVKHIHDNPHNKLVEVLGANGIFGFLAYCAIWILLFVTIISAFRQTQRYEQMSILILCGAMLCFFINIMFLFDTTTGMMQFALLTSMFIYYEHKYNTFAKIKQKLVVPDKYITHIDFGSIKFVTSICVVAIVVLIIFTIPFKQYNAARYAAETLRSQKIKNIDAQYYFYQQAVSEFWYQEPVYFNILYSFNKYVEVYYRAHSRGKTNRTANLDLVSVVLEYIGNSLIENESQNFRLYMLILHTYIYLSIFDDSYSDMVEYYYERSAETVPTHPRLSDFNDFIFNK